MGLLDEVQRLSQSSLLTDVSALLAARAQAPSLFGIFPRALSAEGFHSDILRWLLDPQGWHGFGGRFCVELLRRWWKKSEAPGDLKLGEEIVVEWVVAEYPTGRGPIDILLRGTWGNRPFALGIENKAGAVEGSSQVHDYAEGLVRRLSPATLIMALLTPQGDPPDPHPAVPWAALSYADVAEAMESTHESSDYLTAGLSHGAAAKGREVVRDYLDLVRRHIMGQDNALDELCWKVYSEHRDAWRAIRTRLPSHQDDAHRLLGHACAQLFELRLKGVWNFAVQHDAFALVFRPGWSKKMGQWTSYQLVRFGPDEALPVIPAVHFRLTIQLDDESDAGVPTLAVRLKCDLRRSAAGPGKVLQKRLQGSFGSVEGMRSRQFTLTLGKHQVKRVGPVHEVDERISNLAAESVFEHFEKLSKAVGIIDRVAGRR
jgi:PD-(D/E)XK nuclease superfamily